MGEQIIHTRRASLGPAEKMDRAAALGRTQAAAMHRPEELDERQERIGRTRRRGGPDLADETRRRAEDEDETPDIPPTETREPPGDEN